MAARKSRREAPVVTKESLRREKDSAKVVAIIKHPPRPGRVPERTSVPADEILPPERGQSSESDEGEDRD